MNGGSMAALKNLCAILKIPLAATQPDPFVALQLLLNLYGMPLIKDHSARRNYGNAILGATAGHFDPNSQFVGLLGGVVIMMQEFPNYFTNLNALTEQLVSNYKSLATRNRFLEVMGFVGGSTAITAGIGEGLKRRSVAAGVAKTAGRAAGHGAITEGIAGGFGASLPKGSGAVAVALIAGANITYYSGKDTMREIRAILSHRQARGELTTEQFQEVFGNEIDPSSLKKYW